MSTPFIGEEFTFTQPDGTQIRLRGWGDQNRAVFETLDGRLVVRGSSGAYEYATVGPDGHNVVSTGTVVGASAPPGFSLAPAPRAGDAGPPTVAFQTSLLGRDTSTRWKERRDQRRQLDIDGLALGPGGILAAPPTRHTIGTYTGLCILMDFPDVSGTIDRGEVDNYCNQSGYTGFGNNGSVRDYFLDVSSNKLDYSNIVVGYFTAARERSYYTDPAIEQPIRAWELIEEGLTALQNDGFDFTQLTTDSSGFVRAINIFYAGTRVNNWAEGLWPHSYHLQSPISLGPGRRAYDYQFTDMTSELSLATFCHENGHMICDFPDLYDYDYDSNGCGSFCLMCAGGSVDPKNPTHVGAYLKYQAGWANSVTPLGPGTHSIDAGSNDFFIHAKDDVEYFLVENREATGRDLALPGSGLAIWHVDENGDNDLQHMTATQHYECSLEQADGDFDLESEVNNGDAADLFSASTVSTFGPSTTPSSHWWDGTASALVIENIGASGPTMTFEVPGSSPSTITVSSTPMVTIPDNTATGIRASLTVSEPGDVAAIEVAVMVTHSYIGDLVLALIAPSGRFAVLHNRQGGAGNDIDAAYTPATNPALQTLVGEPITGVWQLAAIDLAAGDVGQLRSWELRITPSPVSSVNVSESPGATIPDNNVAGISRSLTVTDEGILADLAVDVDISHSYIGDLVVELESPSGTVAVLHHRAGGFADNIMTTFDTGSSAALAGLLDEPMAGVWTLRVSDHAGADIGKLNRWGLHLVPAP